MRVEEYRGVPFLYREDEIEFLIRWFNESPQRILFVYGPKSSGKTTIMEYVIERRLLSKGNRRRFWVKYFNLGEALISSYDSFLDTFFVNIDDNGKERGSKVGINVLGFKAEVYQKVKKKQLNLFKVFIEEIEKVVRRRKRSIIIIDEIQKLRDVYIRNGNGERELLKEFLNFCIRLTKEKHLSHVVILTSNTVFIERIYNDAKMKETSEFMKVNHLSKDEVYEWLGGVEGIGSRDIELIWEYVGGNISRIMKILREYKVGGELSRLLERERWLAYTEIKDYIYRGGFSEDEKDMFVQVCKYIVNDGYFDVDIYGNDEYMKVIDRWAEKEILFYDPLELKVMGNSRIYEKGMELLLERRRV